MNRITARIKRYTRRRRSVRKNIFGSPTRPRLTVTRSGKNMYAQVIDDTSGKRFAPLQPLKKMEKLKVVVIVVQQKKLEHESQRKQRKAGVDTCHL